MKKLVVFMSLLVTIMSLTTSFALAAGPQKNLVDLGDGYWMEETINSYHLERGGSRVSGNKSAKVMHGSKLVGTATLTATFDISGASAKVIDHYIWGFGENGGVYVQGSSRSSGNTAYGTAYFSFNDADKVAHLSISCSSNGTLS